MSKPSPSGPKNLELLSSSPASQRQSHSPATPPSGGAVSPDTPSSTTSQPPPDRVALTSSHTPPAQVGGSPPKVLTFSSPLPPPPPPLPLRSEPERPRADIRLAFPFPTFSDPSEGSTVRVAPGSSAIGPVYHRTPSPDNAGSTPPVVLEWSVWGHTHHHHQQHSPTNPSSITSTLNVEREIPGPSATTLATVSTTPSPEHWLLPFTSIFSEKLPYHPHRHSPSSPINATLTPEVGIPQHHHHHHAAMALAPIGTSSTTTVTAGSSGVIDSAMLSLFSLALSEAPLPPAQELSGREEAGAALLHPAQAVLTDQGQESPDGVLDVKGKGRAHEEEVGTTAILSTVPEGDSEPKLELCTHKDTWKRLRAKRGKAYFACSRCGAKWRTQTNTDAPTAKEYLIPPILVPIGGTTSSTISPNLGRTASIEAEGSSSSSSSISSPEF